MQTSCGPRARPEAGWGAPGPGVLSALHRPAGQGPRPALPAGCRGTPSPHPPASPGRRPGRALEVRAGLERQCTHFLCRPPPPPPDSTAPWTGEACFPLRPARPSGLGAGWPAGGLVRPRPGTPLRMCSGPRAARGRWSRVPQVRSCSLGSPGLCPIANQFPGPRLPGPGEEKHSQPGVMGAPRFPGWSRPGLNYCRRETPRLWAPRQRVSSLGLGAQGTPEGLQRTSRSAFPLHP